MAATATVTATVILALFVSVITIAAASTATYNSIGSSHDSITPAQELERMLEALRSHGYNLFGNAITTSDLQYQLLTPATVETPESDPPSPSSSASGYVAAFESATSLTIFAPRDTDLYALDMASDAPAYVNNLRYHVIPNRFLTLSDLQSSTHYLRTLVPHHTQLIISNKTAQIHRFQNGNNNGGCVTVDGVWVSNPNLYVGSRIVVHGLDGILAMRFGQNDDDSDWESEKGSSNPWKVAPPEGAASPEFGLNVPSKLLQRSAFTTEMGKSAKLKKHRKQHLKSKSRKKQHRRVDHWVKDLEF